MNIRILFLVSFIIEIMSETGFGFSRVIFTGFSLKNLLLLILLVAVFSTGSKNNKLERKKRFIYSTGIHKNYLLYLLIVIIATTLAYTFIDFQQYDPIKIIMAIKGTILDPYLVFLIFLLYPKDRQEIDKVLKIILFIVVVLAGMTIVASVISPGIFFGLDNDAARPNGPFGEPNQTAAVLSMILLIVVAPLIRSRKFSFGRLISAILLLGCILVTGSRGGLLAVVLASAYFLFSIRRYMGVGKKITIFLAIFFGVIITWLILPEHIRDLIISRLGIFDSSHINWKEASSGRTQLWTRAIQEWLKSPVFGIGWMGYGTMFGSPTHNSYLEILVSSGPIGLLFYGLVVKNILSSFNTTKTPLPANEIITLKGYKSAVIALFCAIFFVNLYIPWLVVWAMFGLMVGYSCMVNEEAFQDRLQVSKKDDSDKRILSWKKGRQGF